jgi:NitT/TauT family transport system substrate-binding protein
MLRKVSRRQVLESMAIGLLGLSAAGRVSAQARAKLRLVLPTPATTYQLPYLVAKDTGWYAERGLDVEEIYVGGDSTALRTVISGSGDVTLIGPPTVFHAFLEGAKLKYIGSSQPVVDYNILAAKDTPNLAALADKTFASAGPSDLTTEIPRLVMRKHGINTDNVKFLQVGGHPARLQALEVGKVQGAMVNTLTMMIGQKNGHIKVLANVAKEFPQLGYVMYTAMTASLADPARYKAWETFIQGNIVGARMIHSNPERAAQILSKRAPDLPADLVLAVIKELNGSNVWGIDGGLDAQMVKFSSDSMTQWKMIDRGVTAEDIIDDRFVKSALAGLPR